MPLNIHEKALDVAVRRPYVDAVSMGIKPSAVTDCSLMADAGHVKLTFCLTQR